MASMPGITTLAELCEVRARTHPHRPCVDDGELALDHAGLLARARACAARLLANGVQPGDRVLLVGRNTTHWVVAAFGTLLLGASVVPLGRASTLHERQTAVARLRPRVALLDPIDATAGELGIPTLDLDTVVGGATVADVPSSQLPAGPGPESEALVLGTSGTTGEAKHVAMSHGQLTRLYAAVSARVGLGDGDRLLGAVPLAHSFGLNGVLLIAMFAGAMVRLVPAYDRTTLADVVRDQRLTVVAGPPTILHDLAASGTGHVGGSVRLVVTGSTEVHADRVRALADELGIPEVVVGYGMTETCGTVALGRLPATVESATSLLDVLDEVEAKVVDDEGAEVATGSTGRLLVRGFNVVRTHADDDRAPAALPGGWFDTGDLAHFDTGGRLAVVSRRKDTVIVSGFNVVPQEVERVLLDHPQVEQVAVVGVPDERQGERLVACVVPVSTDLEPESLLSHARARLPGYKVPHAYVRVEALPVTATGKVSRRDVRRLAEGRS